MKHSITKIITVLGFIMLLSVSVLTGSPGETEKYYFGIKMNNKLVGYSEITTVPGKDKSKPISAITAKLVIKLTLLGQDVNFNVNETYRLDCSEGKVLDYKGKYKTGAIRSNYSASIDRKNGVLKFESSSGGRSLTVPYTPDIIIPTPISFSYLLEAWKKAPQATHTFRLVNTEKRQVDKIEFRVTGEELFTIDGKAYNALQWEAKNITNGTTRRLWIDRETGIALRSLRPDTTDIFLTDPRIVKHIRRETMDDLLLGKADTVIHESKKISYMKVEALIQSGGEPLTPESLNLPGQTFTGTVKDNLLNGIFEIRHTKYDGTNAPAFPTDYSSFPDLKNYLEPEFMIESNDPVLVKKAKEITSGAKNNWEAAIRISRWVSENLTYSNPGGSARHVFNTRKGEGGSHSRLVTAFCRGVGIPARMVTGCIYTPYLGGNFRQHGWNEVYMGDAGWIPIDATLKENDYCDSGHIRLGLYSAFFSRKMKILDFKAGKQTKDSFIHDLPTLTKLKIEKDQTFEYVILYKDRKIGTYSFCLNDIEKIRNRDIYHFDYELRLGGEYSSGHWKIYGNGLPVVLESKGKSGTSTTSLKVEFKDGKIDFFRTRNTKTEQTDLPLTPPVYLLGQKNFGQQSTILSAITDKPSQSYRFKFFHPESGFTLPGSITKKGNDTITIQGKEHQCMAFDLIFAGQKQKIWADKNGVLLKIKGGDGSITVERRKSNKTFFTIILLIAFFALCLVFYSIVTRNKTPNTEQSIN